MAKWKDEQIFKEGNSYKVFLPEKNRLFTVDNFGITDDLVGLYVDDVEFNDEGKINWLKIDDEKYHFKKANAPKSTTPDPPSKPSNASDSNKTPRRDESRQEAPAPYNFVSLNQTVVPSNAQVNDFSVYDGLSGYIDVTVTTQTPLFIRGIGAEFFKIGEDMAIPGSSFRGLIRTMVEMISYSKLNSIDATKSLFMRFVAAFKSDFKEQYASRLGMSTEGGERSYEAKAGFLYFDHSAKKYYVKPSSYEVLKQLGLNRKFQRHEGPSNRFCEVYTGLIGGKKAYYKFFYPSENTKKIVVDDDVIRDYREDKDRKVPNSFNALEACKNNPRGFPIFFTSKMVKDEKGKDYEVIDSFGHTKYYRLPYLKRIGELRLKSHLEQKFDFAESIFGVIDEKKQVERAGKVYFEDLFMTKGQELPEKRTQILGSPKPTSFQLYLEQPHRVKTHKEDLVHWDTPDAKIRGNKNYWHRITSNNANQPYSWVQSNAQNTNDRDNSIRNQDPIKAVKEGSVFTGRIRFDNLSQEELGVLLCALNLPGGCCHKIGMGKPLGLGSIRVEAELSLINRKERYQNLFDINSNWNEAKNKEEEDNYKNAFTSHIFTEVGQEDKNNATSFWDLPRMKELKKMLTFDAQFQADEAWLKITRYQALTEFRERKVLPKPEEVK